MYIKHLFRTGMGLVLVALVSVQGMAFMNTVEHGDSDGIDSDYVQLVDGIANDLKSDEVDCGEMLTKIDEALDQIDESLDAGVIDEESLLIARDALVSMRLELPCLSDQLTQAECCGPEIAPANVISEQVIGSEIIDGGFAGGGGGGGGAAGGGGAVGGVGLRRLLAIGGLTGGIIAGATSGGDDPAPETSL